MHQFESSRGKITEGIEEIDHRHSEVGGLLRPPVDRVKIGITGVDEIEHLLMVPSPLREFAIEIAERVAFRTHDGETDRSVGVEERSRGDPSGFDERVEVVTAQQEEPVITTGSIERIERRLVRSGDVDDGDGVHRELLVVDDLRGKFR